MALSDQLAVKAYGGQNYPADSVLAAAATLAESVVKAHIQRHYAKNPVLLGLSLQLSSV